MKRKKKSASRRGGGILSVDTYSLMGDPVASSGGYHGFGMANRDDAAALDDVLITTTVPAGLTNDLNLNGVSDASEIYN
jgi:hypothetical protein